MTRRTMTAEEADDWITEHGTGVTPVDVWLAEHVFDDEDEHDHTGEDG